MTNLAEVLVPLVRAKPGLTAAQLYASLGRWKAKARGELYVAAALERHKETFRCDGLTGRWYLCDTALPGQGSPAESPSRFGVGEASAASRLGADDSGDQDDPRTVDRELRRRLLGYEIVVAGLARFFAALTAGSVSAGTGQTV
jgi:hypothetical protein